MIARKILLGCFFILAASGFTGCAAILSPEKGPNILKSEPSGADVFDENNKSLGTTPFNMGTLNIKVRMLRIKMDGYRDLEIYVSHKSNNDLLFVDALLLCIPCPFDIPGGKTSYTTPRNGTVRLRKVSEDKGGSVMAIVDKPTLSQSISNAPAKINSVPKGFDDKVASRIIGNVEDQADAVISASRGSYLELSQNTSEHDRSALSRPKLNLHPEITRLSFDLHGKTMNDYEGDESISCTWNVYSISNKTKSLGSFQTSTALSRMPGNGAHVLDQLMTESALDLLEIDTLYSFLKKAESNYMSDTKGGELRVSAPHAPHYSSSKEMLKAAKSGVVTVLMKDGFGSGVIISSDGYIVTNYHVVENQKNVQIKLNAEMKLKATVVKTNSDYDLALLKVEADDLKALSFGNSDSTEAGDEVYAIGTPLETSLGQSVTRGIISGRRNINGMNFLQSDVSINAGNSGGPLLNEKGEVIGIATMKLQGKGIEGIGFGIPSNSIIEMLNIKF